MEITVISAEGLKKPSRFSNHLKPFIILTTSPPSDVDVQWWTQEIFSCGTKVGRLPNLMVGAQDFHIPNFVDATFFQLKSSCIYLHLYTDRFLLGHRLLGWCGIPASDIADGLWPVGTARKLSYRLRQRDGLWGPGIVNVKVKLEGSIFEADYDRNRFEMANLSHVSSDVQRLTEDELWPGTHGDYGEHLGRGW